MVSTTGPTGPYTFRDVALPTFSHNAAPITLPDGTFAIFHVGAGTGAADGGNNCTANSSVRTLDENNAMSFQDFARDERST